MLRFSIIIFFIFSLLLTFCKSQNKTPKVEGKKGRTVTMKLISSAFEEGRMIPPKYTCDGQDVSPPLSWSDVPQETRSFALICDDPDAPMGTWVHWVIYNIPDTTRSLPEAIPPSERLDNGTLQGKNDFKRYGYGGPCPPGGTHRYFFKLYALDDKLDLPPGATKAQLLQAMNGHIVGEAQLMGKYSR
ncbi:YbhB/YbcL family Raf kinase inhibitor-like protein [Calditrichota bacterium GD2]